MLGSPRLLSGYGAILNSPALPKPEPNLGHTRRGVARPSLRRAALRGDGETEQVFGVGLVEWMVT